MLHTHKKRPNTAKSDGFASAWFRRVDGSSPSEGSRDRPANAGLSLTWACRFRRSIGAGQPPGARRVRAQSVSRCSRAGLGRRDAATRSSDTRSGLLVMTSQRSACVWRNAGLRNKTQKACRRACARRPLPRPALAPARSMPRSLMFCLRRGSGVVTLEHLLRDRRAVRAKV